MLPTAEEALSGRELPPKRPLQPYQLDDFEFLETIGRACHLPSTHAFDERDHALGTGTFGRVRLVRCNADRRFYALKILNKTKIIKLHQVHEWNLEFTQN